MAVPTQVFDVSECIIRDVLVGDMVDMSTGVMAGIDFAVTFGPQE